MTCPKLSDRCIKVYLEHSDAEMYKKYCGIVGHCEKRPTQLATLRRSQAPVNVKLIVVKVICATGAQNLMPTV